MRRETARVNQAACISRSSWRGSCVFLLLLISEDCEGAFPSSPTVCICDEMMDLFLWMNFLPAAYVVMRMRWRYEAWGLVDYETRVLLLEWSSCVFVFVVWRRRCFTLGFLWWLLLLYVKLHMWSCRGVGFVYQKKSVPQLLSLCGFYRRVWRINLRVCLRMRVYRVIWMSVIEG